MRKVLLLMVATTVVWSSCKKHDAITPLNPANADSVVTIMGTTYPVVKIGSQSWTAINYSGPGGIYNTGSGELSTLNGKLYTPQEAHQIVLPAGWRIPTYNDYLTLLITRGAIKNDDGSYSAGLVVAHSLMSATGWAEGGGNNYSYFNALPTGFYHLQAFVGSGNGASFLHSTTVGAEPDQGFMIGPGIDGQPMIFLGIYLVDGDACSLRFVKDN